MNEFTAHSLFSLVQLADRYKSLSLSCSMGAIFWAIQPPDESTRQLSTETRLPDSYEAPPPPPTTTTSPSWQGKEVAERRSSSEKSWALIKSGV